MNNLPFEYQIVPLSESEWTEYLYAHQFSRKRAGEVTWVCLCGANCKISLRALVEKKFEARCSCKRNWRYVDYEKLIVTNA